MSLWMILDSLWSFQSLPDSITKLLRFHLPRSLIMHIDVEMAVSAHASLLSLLHILDQVQHHSLSGLQLDTRRIKRGQQLINSLLDFLQIYDLQRTKNQIIEDLLLGLAKDAYEAETAIHSQVVDQVKIDEKIRVDSMIKGSLRRMTDFPHRVARMRAVYKAIDKIKPMKSELLVAKEEWVQGELHPVPEGTIPTSSTPLAPLGKRLMVGFDGHLARIMDQLIRGESCLQISTITGMGGTGKTTLATNVFEHPNIISHFDRRIWVTISEKYDLKQILQCLLADQENQENDMSLSELGEMLHKELFHRRFLLVIDDLWSVEAWEDLKKFFPNYENRSRVMVTTRSSDVGIYISSYDPYPIGFLDEHESWKLFCQTLFIGEEEFPSELMELGNYIVKSCRGLPLAIVVVGGLLAKSGMRREFWELVAKDVNSFANSGDDDRCLKILSLSYVSLPIHLKPCFLYLGRFGEDQEISISTITDKWIAEGFIKPAKAKSLKQVAREYLEDLVGRNMVIIRRRGSTGKVKSFSIHDLLRDVCQRRSREENFMRIPRVQSFTKEQGKPYTSNQEQGKASHCFTCGKEDWCERIQLDVERSVCIECKPRYAASLSGIKVVSIFDPSDPYNQDILPTDLGYLHLIDRLILSIPRQIYLLWRLQTLIIDCVWNRGPIPFVLEIWKLPHLRHLDIGVKNSCRLEVEYAKTGMKQVIIMENLHTVAAPGFKFTDEMIIRMPNLKKLKSSYEVREFLNFSNISHLQELEVLHLTHVHFFNPILPDSIRKLVLIHCLLSPGDIGAISLLPKLERFQFDLDSKDFEWYPIDGGFLQLKFLKFRGHGLTLWEAEAHHFPKLERLEIGHVAALQSIPLGIGDIDTLQSIRLAFVGTSFLNSIRVMMEEQLQLGNDSLRVYIHNKQLQFNDSL